MIFFIMESLIFLLCTAECRPKKVHIILPFSGWVSVDTTFLLYIMHFPLKGETRFCILKTHLENGLESPTYFYFLFLRTKSK